MTASLINSLLTTQVADRTSAINTALLPYTTTSAMNILLASTISGQMYDRTNAINTSLTSANAYTNTALSNYTNTIAMNSLINTNMLNQQTLTATNLNNAINTNNTVYLANLLANNYLTSTLTNNAITTSSNSNNIFSTAYTNSKILTEVTRADLALSNAIIANNLLHTTTANIGSGSQFNSVSVGQNIKLYNAFSTAIGNNASTTNYGCAIGYNAGSLSNTNNASCTYIGSNSNITQGSNFINSTAIGSGATISASNQIMLGVIDSIAYCANITTPNLTSTIHNVSQQIISYNTLPLFLSQKYTGFITSSMLLKTVSNFNTYINLGSISIIPGVFMVQFQITYNYSVSNLLSWWSYGVGTTGSNLEIQSCKSYCSSSTTN